MKFTQKIQTRGLFEGKPDEPGPAITITVEAEAGYPLSPDLVSQQLGHFIMKLLGPGKSMSVKSTVAPWPLPDDWSALRDRQTDFQRGYDYAIMLVDTAAAGFRSGGRHDAAQAAEEIAKVLREVEPNDGEATVSRSDVQ